MNKPNLHTFMLVALRTDPRMYTVLRDVSIDTSYYSGILTNYEGDVINLNDYTEDLSHKKNSDLDIVRVYLKTDLTFSRTEPSNVKLVYESPAVERMSFKDALLVDGTMKPNMECIPSGFECFQTPRIVLDKLASIITVPDSYRNLILADWFVHRR